MRFIIFAALLGLASSTEASFFSKKTPAMDKEGNCVPALVAENARLYTEIEALDKIATRAETQLKSPLKESQKLGFDGLKELSTKAKATRGSIKKFGDTYGDAACKAQVAKTGKKTPEIVMIQVKERVSSLDKLAAQYEQIADNFLKTHAASK